MPISPDLFRLRQKGRYGIDYTSEHERAPSPYSIPIKVRSPRSILRGTFRIIMALMVASVNLFAFLNLAILVWEDCIIEWCVSRWKVELRGLDLGPAPSWLDDPPWDFDHLPPGADEYANFSLDLSIENNPKWLHVEILDVRVNSDFGLLVYLFTEDVSFSGAADVSIFKKTWLPLHALKGGVPTREAKSKITKFGREIAKKCADFYYDFPDGKSLIAGMELGEVAMLDRASLWSSVTGP
ncbi:hypothetical protein FOL46_009459 [Perkinsus olseni]|uniref:Uncharacterized protein n=1 Tax=Perkinsus olseni TaxID=32597 RepID=A0A7J6KZT7_PEROL|nr:hypothetical protein FOL46_009459 [Perkinsus olseni]